MIDISITKNDENSILPEKERYKYSARQFRELKKNFLLERYRGLKDLTTNDLLLAILETNTKILFLLEEKL